MVQTPSLLLSTTMGYFVGLLAQLEEPLIMRVELLTRGSRSRLDPWMPYRCWALDIWPRAGLQVQPLLHYNQEHQFNILPSATNLCEHPHHLFPCPFLLPTPLMMWACSHVTTKPTSDSDEVNPSVLGISQDQPHYPAPPTPPIYYPYFANPSCHPHLSSPHGFQSLSIFPASWTTETAGSPRSLSPITTQGPVPPIELFAFTTDPSESTNQLMSGGRMDRVGWNISSVFTSSPFWFFASFGSELVRNQS